MHASTIGTPLAAFPPAFPLRQLQVRYHQRFFVVWVIDLPNLTTWPTTGTEITKPTFELGASVFFGGS